MGSGTYACASLRLQMGSIFDDSAVNISANPTSDAGTYLPQVPPSSYEEWWSCLRSNILPDSLDPEVSEEEICAGLRPSIQSALARSVDTAGTSHPENFIAIHNEGFPVVCLSNSWFPLSTLLETEGPSSDSAILGINLTDSDTNRIGLHESVSMNFRLDYGHLYARNHATSNFSIPSMPQDVSCTPTAVQGQAESTSRDRPQQLKQTGIGAENASSQPSQRPTDEGETPKGQYPCEICGRRYAQLQGVRRHYRAMHDPSSCSYCDFKWSRPYQYRAHIKKRHRDVIPDVALNEAMWARRRAARNARCIRQQPVLALTPDPDRRVGAETWRGPLTTPPSEAVRATPAHSPAISHVDYGPQSESVELVERKLEDASESELRAAFSSTEELAQRVMDLDMSARGWFRDETQSPYQNGWTACTGAESPSALVPVPVPSPTRPLSEYGDSQVVGSHRVQPRGPTYSKPAPLPTTMRSRESCSHPEANPELTQTLQVLARVQSGILGPDTTALEPSRSGTGAP